MTIVPHRARHARGTGGWADRVKTLPLNQGQIVLSGERDEVVQDPRTRQIYSLDT